MTQWLEGTSVAEIIVERLKPRVAALRRPPRLVVMRIGDDPVSARYIERKKAAAKTLGIDVRVRSFEPTIAAKRLRAALSAVTHHPRTTGVIVQLPLPPHLNTAALLDAIPPDRDVDGLSSRNMGALATGRGGFIPPTAAGIASLLRHYRIPLRGADVTVVGSGRLVGRPVGLLMLQEGATVTFTHEYSRDIQRHTRSADIIISGVGKPRFITDEWIRPGAVVIDAGMTVIDGRTVGDVDADRVANVAAWLTPIPGGVGPLTVACLMQNVVMAAEHDHY